MAAATKNGLRLQITAPDGSVIETISQDESVIVGSGAQAAVKISDPKVSNLHVMLKVDKSGKVTAIDLGSESGTRLGDQRIAAPMALSSGDVLIVGASQVRVMFGGEPEPERPAGAAVPGHALQDSIQHVQSALAQKHAIPTVVTPPSAPPGLRPRRSPAPALVQSPRVGVAERRPAEAQARVPAHLQEPLPPEALPTADLRVLQVALLWGDRLLSVEHFRDGVPVTVGEAQKCAFHVFTPEVGQRHVLAVSKKGGVEVRVPRGAGMFVTQHGTVRSKEALRQARQLTTKGHGELLTLGLHDRAEIALGNVSLVLRNVRPSPLVRAKTLEKADYTFFKIASICLLAFLAAVAAVVLTPRTEGSTADDIFQNRQLVAKFLITPKKREPAPKPQRSGVEEGAKAKEEEGKLGKEEAKKPQADPSKPGSRVTDKNKKEKDRQKVASVGLLGAMSSLKGCASNVFGPGGLGVGINSALGGLKAGAGLGDQQGVGGLGSRGQGTGGGGTALGLGGLGTQGTGRGSGGKGGIELGGRGKEITKVIPGRTTVVGGLDKDIIQKIIRRHQNEIKYCYESELNKKPDLAGKVAVAFTIDPTGAVSEANVAESTLSNTAAEQCMLARIRRWKFPEPKGGGVVAVTYPWLFAPAGSDR